MAAAASLIMNETCCGDAGINKRETASRPYTPSRQHDVKFYIGIIEHISRHCPARHSLDKIEGHMEPGKAYLPGLWGPWLPKGSSWALMIHPSWPGQQRKRTATILTAGLFSGPGCILPEKKNLYPRIFTPVKHPRDLGLTGKPIFTDFSLA